MVLRALCWATVVGLVATTASADTLDQESLYKNASFNADATSLNWQQEVVVGLGGPLVRVEMYSNRDSGSCKFYLNKGAPWQGDPPDFETTLVVSGQGWQSIDTSKSGLVFNPGDRFVIGIVGGGNGLWLGGSYELPDGGYPKGKLFLNGNQHADGGWDLAFRTYVPEPASVTLLLLALAFRRR